MNHRKAAQPCLSKEPTRNIMSIITLDGEEIPVEFTQQEYLAIEETAGGCVTEFIEQAARETAYEHMARRKIIKFPSGEFQPS
jgi:hypothetical protein